MRIGPPLPASTAALLTYCTNSHTGETVPQIEAALRRVFGPVRDAAVEHAQQQQTLGIGLWLSAETVQPLRDDRRRLDAFRRTLRDLRLAVPSLNAFPFGNFHADEVKYRVYEPGWWDPRRADYTIACAEVLAHLAKDAPADWPRLPATISSVGVGNRETATETHLADAREQLGRVAGELARIHEETGVEIVLALEPEPLTWLETTPEAIRFFAELYGDTAAIDAAGDDAYLPRYIGVCFDACHQAVLWEDVAESFRAYCEAGVRIGKVQVSCAVERPRHVDPQTALGPYAEPRYLHQVYARQDKPQGALVGASDLSDALANPGWMRDRDWRCHFHVPIYLKDLGDGLRSTQPSLQGLLAEIHRRAAGEGDGSGSGSGECEPEPAPILEIETYTWSVLPPGLLPPDDRPETGGTPGGPAGLIREIEWLRTTWASFDRVASASQG